MSYFTSERLNRYVVYLSIPLSIYIKQISLFSTISTIKDEQHKMSKTIFKNKNLLLFSSWNTVLDKDLASQDFLISAQS